MYFNIKSFKIKFFKLYIGIEVRYLNIIVLENGVEKEYCG